MIKHLPTHNLIWSNLLAQCSEQIALAAAPIVVVVMLGGGAFETGLVQLIQTLPFLLLSLPMGAIVDRVSRKGLMVSSEFLRAGTAGGIVLAMMFDVLSVPLLAVLGFLGAIGTLAFSIAGPALLPALVERDELPSMNRWLELARSSAFVAGPPLAGALVAWSGGSMAFATAIVASLMAIVLLAPLHEPARPPAIRLHIGHELIEGARFVTGHRLLMPIAATAMAFNVGWFMLQTVLVVFLIDYLGATADAVGVLLAFYGLGMITGAIASNALSRTFTLGQLIVIGPLGGFIGSSLVLAAWAWPSHIWIGIALFCFGFGPVLWAINTTSLRQVVTPHSMQGRVTALLTFATAGARPVGAGVGMILTSSAGLGACLVGSALCFAVQLGIILISAPGRLRELPGQLMADTI